MRITDVEPEDESRITQVAQLLLDGFAHLQPPTWPNLRSAIEEVRPSLHADRISLVALSPDDRPIGWIAGSRYHRGLVWELHPVVVAPMRWRKGIGAGLLRAFEKRVADHGGLTIYAGISDVSGATTLGGVNLYPAPAKHLGAVTVLSSEHPLGFFEKMGFAINGVIPDVNGLGKPDIIVAKRVRRIV